MIKKIIEKRNYFIFGIIIVLIFFLFFNNKKTEQSQNYYYFGEKITIVIYEKKNVSKIFDEIEKIYELWDKDYKNLYSKNKVSKQMKKLLNYGVDLYNETGGLIDITAGDLISSIQDDRYFDFKTSINEIDFNNKDTLKKINIDSIIGSYVLDKIKTYLEKKDIYKYLINQDGNILAGQPYNKEKYSISIHDNDAEVIDIVYLENEVMVTKGNTDTFKPYMVDPISSMKVNNNKIVLVIGKEIKEVNKLCNILYLKSIDDGKKYIKKYDVEAFWYSEDKKYSTKNFKKYQQK